MSETTLVDSSMDFASLAKMRLDAARNPEKTVDKVAEQFESIFINMMLKSMRLSLIHISEPTRPY